MDDLIFPTLQGLFGGRVYPVVLPDSPVYPALVYQYVGNSEEDFVNAGRLIERFRVQFKIYAKEYDQCSGLRLPTLQALRQLDEFIEQFIDLNDYESETRLHVWILDLAFRRPQ